MFLTEVISENQARGHTWFDNTDVVIQADSNAK